jgi:diguanylate cyclase (GGDEF)-like protein
MPSQEHFSILLVDDDTLVIRTLSRMLAEFAPLRFATSGRVALKLALDSLPDLVLLDVDMPEVSGFEICKAFKRHPALAQVPIIFITSYESPELEQKGLQLGAADFISKPPHAALVLARVHTFQRMKMLSDTIQDSVQVDAITGAATRQQLERSLTKEWLRAQRSAAPLVLLMADVDGFTAYSAEFGEQQGDICLHTIADALRSVMHRPTDLLGRYPGSKFGLLLPETDSLGAIAVAHHAIDAVDALHLVKATSTDSDYITLSVGGGCRDALRPSSRNAGEDQLTLVPLAGATPDELITAAEQALMGAKAAGGHQVRYVDIANRDSARVVALR